MTAPAIIPMPDAATGDVDGPLVLEDVLRGNRSDAAGFILAGLARTGEVPAINTSRYDLLLTTASRAPRPWVALPPAEFDAAVESMMGIAARNPAAARVLAQVLRINESVTFDDALLVESFAYSTLLGGAEFRAWRGARSRRPGAPAGGARVRYAREDDVLTIRLCNPRRHNAFDARLRDELLEALQVAEHDPGLRVEIRADGPNFCSGGDLDEFGQATDLALAHQIRTRHSVCRALQRLGERATCHVHGVCIGAGIEIPAAARISAQPTARFQLPELTMGLIPGAGGTASIPRRIGRHRTLFWALANLGLDARGALEWGLIDHIAEPS